MEYKILRFLSGAALFFSVGLLWGLAFLGIFGAAFEYSWMLFGYSMLGGIAFSVLFFLALSLVFKLEKKIENRQCIRVQKILEKTCAPFMSDGVFTIDGKRTYANMQTKMK